jgi:hypothetical protein
MGAIMIDKLSIENIVEYLGDDYPGGFGDYFYEFSGRRDPYSLEQCWDNFLTAIVLWDEIWHFETRDYAWENMFIHPKVINNIKNIVHKINIKMIDEPFYNMFFDLTQIDSSRTPNFHRHTIAYQLISNSLGVPFLAHPRRATHLFDELIHFSRFDLLKRVDKELIKYYNNINNILKRDLLRFNYPVLVDYIISKANTPEEEIEAAMSLRNEKFVVDFRNQMNKIELSIKNGDTQKILSELKMVSDLAKDITKRYNKKTKLGEFSISLSPSLTIPLNFSKNSKRELHATFIRKLINFGVDKRVVKR